MSISNGIIKKFIAGDKKATELVYVEYKYLMYFVIASYVTNPSDCEDLLSDSFIDAIEHRTNITDFKTFKNYLTTIAKNNALNFLKKRKDIPSSDTIEEIYGQDDNKNDFLSTIEPLLTNKETIVVYLKAGFGYTWQEISEETGVSESTARRLYESAKNKLRRDLL